MINRGSKSQRNVIINQSAVTATTSFGILNPNIVPRNETVEERIGKWFITPLRQMEGSYGYIVLMVLLPLYEKHLRVRHGMTGDFSRGNRIFRTMGKRLKVSEDDAYEFWSHVRNGLLHRAAPNEETSFRCIINTEGPAIKRNGNEFFVNPFAMRDLLLQEIEPDLRMWRDDDTPLAVTYDPVLKR